jgi:hypothetical protein
MYRWRSARRLGFSLSPSTPQVADYHRPLRPDLWFTPHKFWSCRRRSVSSLDGAFDASLKFQIVDRFMLQCLGNFLFNSVVSPFNLGRMHLDCHMVFILHRELDSVSTAQLSAVSNLLPQLPKIVNAPVTYAFKPFRIRQIFPHFAQITP